MLLGISRRAAAAHKLWFIYYCDFLCQVTTFEEMRSRAKETCIRATDAHQQLLHACIALLQVLAVSVGTTTQLKKMQTLCPVRPPQTLHSCEHCNPRLRGTTVEQPRGPIANLAPVNFALE